MHLVRGIQSWLLSRGQAATTAAGISYLLAGQNTERVITLARESFLYVGADCLTREDMAENTPNPELRKHTRKGRFGHVDAFVSHSWHDDSPQKWRVLQRWREDFKR